MDSKYIQFYSGLDSFIRTTYRDFLMKIEAEEQAVISKHLELNSKQFQSQEEIGVEVILKYPKLNSFRNLLKYTILSYYMTDWTRFELQEVLRKKYQQLHFPELDIYLQSREYCLMALFLELDLRLNDVFGNLLVPGIVEIQRDSEGRSLRIKRDDFCFLSLKRRNSVKKKERRRGYNDHGSLADFSKRVRGQEASKEAYLEQLQIENIRIQENLLQLKRLATVLPKLSEGVGR